MANKRIGPEAKIIALFTALPDDSKRIVADIIKAQTATPRKTVPKSPAPSAGRKSLRKPEGAASTVSTEGGMENVGTASDPAPRYVPICAVCGNVELHADHSIKSRDYHIFRTSIKQKAKVNGEDKVQGVPA